MLDQEAFLLRKRYFALFMKAIITFFLMSLITFHTVVKESKDPLWYALLGNLLQLWTPSLSQEDKEDNPTKKHTQ